MSQSHVIDVNQADFQREVLQRSHQVPVLVDFWAPWCGPCRMLSPTLEKLAREFNGRFILAKINTDLNPQLSARYDIRGIPNVKAFHRGQVVDEFVGVQPEPRVREFIQRLAPPAAPRPAQTAAASPPGQADLAQVKAWLRQADGCRAEAALRAMADTPHAAEARRLLPLATFLCRLGRGETLSGRAGVQDLHRQAGAALQRREPSAALYQLMMALQQETPAGRGETRQVMEAVLALLGDGDPLVAPYRQQLARLPS